jgi:hypothetical protein
MDVQKCLTFILAHKGQHWGFVCKSVGHELL